MFHIGFFSNIFFLKECQNKFIKSQMFLFLQPRNETQNIVCWCHGPYFVEIQFYKDDALKML